MVIAFPASARPPAVLLAGLLWLVPCVGTAQPRHVGFEHLSTGDGLSNGEVKCVAEDSLGYLWIGTADGLNRYDGYGFRVFRHSGSDSTTPGDSYITALTVDRSGTLWAGTREGGLCRYDAGRERFERFTARPGDATSLGEGAVTDVYEDRAGTLWVTTSHGGLSRLDRDRGRFRRFSADPSDPRAPRSNNLGPIYDDGRGTLWIGSWSAGFHAFTPGDGTFRQYGRYPGDTSLVRGIAGVISIFPDSSGKLWVGTRRQLNLFDPVTRRFEPVLPDRRNPGRISKNVNAVLVDRFNTLWIGTNADGLILVDLNGPIGEKFIHYRYGKDRSEDGWIPSSRIDAIHEDSRGNVWVATGDGLLKASRNRHRFRHLRHHPSDPSSLAEDRIRTIAAGGRDSIWVATAGGGLILYDHRAGSFTGYANDPDDPSTIGGDVVTSILPVDGGVLWLGLDGQGVNRFTPATGRFDRFKNAGGAHPDLHSNWINALARTNDGRVWLGSIAGLIGFDPAGRTFDHVETTADHSILAVLPDPDGSLWYGTNGDGLVRYDPGSGALVRFSREPGDGRTISNNRIRSLHRSTDGTLWIGTYGGGLNRFDPSTREFRSFDEGDGLAGDVVEGIVEDGRGILWVSTNKGLSRFDPAAGKFRSYGAADGLPATRFLGDGALLPSGELAFGTFSEGMVLFHPDDLTENPAVPTVLVTAVRKYGSQENLLGRGREELTLSRSENSFTVEFVALDCTAPGKNRYAYRIEGLTPGWVQAGTRRSAEFTNVASGEYALHVRGSNNDGVWGETSAPIRITVLPPFWGTWWFYGASFLALAGALTALHRYRVSRLLEIERLRMRIAGDLHDDLGSNLSGIALMSDLAGRGAASDEERERLAFIGRTARQMAETIKDLAWVVNPGNDTLDNLALRMKDTAAAMLGGIEHTFSVGERPRAIALPIEARRNVFLIYKEALHNIVKHSGATSVDIALQESGDLLRLIVADNGRGFNGEGGPNGAGLRNMRSRAQALGGSLEIESAPRAGTRIVLSVRIP